MLTLGIVSSLAQTKTYVLRDRSGDETMLGGDNFPLTSAREAAGYLFAMETSSKLIVHKLVRLVPDWLLQCLDCVNNRFERVPCS